MDPECADGVPSRVPVTVLKVTPAGRVAPLPSARDGAGVPVAVTGKLPAAPTVNVVAFAEVIAAASSTVRVKAWWSSEPMPLVAVSARL